METNDREKCEMILDEMDSLLVDIGMQWDTRHYSPLLVLEKIRKLQETILNFNFFYKKYVERCEEESNLTNDIKEHLKGND